MTRVGILETGRPSDAIIQRHGDFAGMFRTYFSRHPGLKFTVYPVFAGAPVPAAVAQDAWVITGSPAAVYEDHAWLPPLRDFVRQAVGQTVPTLGVCFGHQIMAQAFGGKVVKSEKGRGIGVHRYDLKPAGQWLGTGVKAVNLIASHQDQVIEAPGDAVVLASSDFCPYAALAYGRAGLSFQPHFEFTVDGARDIVRRWHEQSPVAQDILATAEATFGAVVPDSPRLVPVLGNFLASYQAS